MSHSQIAGSEPETPYYGLGDFNKERLIVDFSLEEKQKEIKRIKSLLVKPRLSH